MFGIPALQKQKQDDDHDVEARYGCLTNVSLGMAVSRDSDLEGMRSGNSRRQGGGNGGGGGRGEGENGRDKRGE